jgi:2-keto-myo-inositol isomerase
MIPCINQATVLPTDTLEFIDCAKEVGFRLVEFDVTKLEEAVQTHGLARIKEAIKSRKMKVISLNAIENYPILTKDDMTKSLDRCERIFKLSQELECEIVVVNPNEFEFEMRAETEKAFDSFITRAAEIAATFSVKLGYEFVAYENRIINTLRDSLGSLSKWDAGVGLVLDVFHLFRTGERVTGVPDPIMNRVWIFHVNDAPQIRLTALKDADRVFPGEGVVDVKETLRELGAKGFAGPVSLELFNALYWKQPTRIILKRSWDSLASLLALGTVGG